MSHSPKNRLPVTIVGGFLGAGKTSLLHHMISEHRGGHLAVLVENPGPLNLDARALRGLCGAMRRTNDAVFEIPNGDEAAQVGAIATTLRDLAQAGRYERVLIEVAERPIPRGWPITFVPMEIWRIGPNCSSSFALSMRWKAFARAMAPNRCAPR